MKLKEFWRHKIKKIYYSNELALTAETLNEPRFQLGIKFPRIKQFWFEFKYYFGRGGGGK